ncbi:MAG: hypothetical protein Q8N23_14810 [Archangium sp.]|nr:hypothetical protein [Archangium sp.]MDP3574216.1 hypothetical protein [Archangium sp.]
MNTLLLLAVMSQTPSYTWSDGTRSHTLWMSPVLVAEPSPTGARAETMKALGATLLVDRVTMRVWKVTDAEAVRTKVAELRPVFHDSRAGVGRYRVPLALVCSGERRALPWLEVLEGSGGACLPDFWYPPVLK